MLIAASVSALVFASMIAFWEYDELKRYKQEKSAMEEQLGTYRQVLYVTTEKISKGSVLTEEKVYQEIRYSDMPQDSFMQEDAFGMTLAMDVAEGTCLTVNMLCETENNMREIFLSGIELPELFQAGDRVDVRIRYHTAEDYIVLADKILLKCNPESGMVLQLTEEEILLISSALADSKEYDGTQLYAVRYPEYAATETAKVNYVARQEILMLLGREKTEGESRTALEKRLLQKQ